MKEFKSIVVIQNAQKHINNLGEYDKNTKERLTCVSPHVIL